MRASPIGQLSYRDWLTTIRLPKAVDRQDMSLTVRVCTPLTVWQYLRKCFAIQSVHSLNSKLHSLDRTILKLVLPHKSWCQFCELLTGFIEYMLVNSVLIDDLICRCQFLVGKLVIRPIDKIIAHHYDKVALKIPIVEAMTTATVLHYGISGTEKEWSQDMYKTLV